MSALAAVLTAVAPAALVLMVSAAVWVALRVWYDPIPARVAGCMLALTFAFFARPLLFGDVLLPLNLLRYQPVFQDLEVGPGPGGYVDQSDLIEDFPAYFSQVRVALDRGEWPLVARSLGAGEPLLANSQAQVLHPFLLLTYLLPLPSIYGVLAAFKLLTSMAFTFLLARRYGMGSAAALGGGVAYGASGFLMHYLGWPQTNSAAALPLLLYAIHRVVSGAAGERGRFRADLLLLAFSVLFLFTGGHPETMTYTAGAAFVFALEGLFRLWRRREEERRSRDQRGHLDGSLRSDEQTASSGGSPVSRAANPPSPSRSGNATVLAFWRLALCGLLGMACSLPVLLPALEAVQTSERKFRIDQARERSGQIGFADSLRANLEGQRRGELFQRSVPLLAPLAFGSERYGRSWGYASIIQEGSGFVGTACLLVIFWALVHGRGRWPRRVEPAARGIPGAATLGDATVEGSSQMPWTLIGAALIGFVAHVQPPGTVWLMTHLPVLSQSGSANRRLNMLLCFGLAMGAAFAWHALTQRAALLHGRILGVAGVVAGTIYWCYGAFPNPENASAQALPRLGVMQTQLLVVGLLTFALLVVAGKRHIETGDATPVSSARSVPNFGNAIGWAFALLVALELFLLHSPLQQASPRSHFFPQRASIDFLQEHLDQHRMIGLGGYFLQNLPAPYGLDDARSGSPLQPIPLMLLTRHLRRSVTSRQIVAADDPVLNLLGVRYVVTGEGRDVPGFMPLRFSGNVDIYERPEAMARLFLIKNARPSLALEPYELPQLTQNFRVHGFVDEIPSDLRHPEHGDWRAADPNASSVEVASITPAHLRGRASIAKSSLLGSSQYQDGGWRVLVNGRRAQPALTNGLFVGAWLPPGEHQIDLVYRSSRFLWALLVASLAVSMALAFWLPVPQLGNRSPPHSRLSAQ